MTGTLVSLCCSVRAVERVCRREHFLLCRWPRSVLYDPFIFLQTSCLQSLRRSKGTQHVCGPPDVCMDAPNFNRWR